MPSDDWFPTLLGLDGITYPDWAVRGLTMTLTPIAMGDLRRDVMGGLNDMTLEQFRKYVVTITCSDQDAPELIDVWKGKIVTVTCLPGLGVGIDTSASDGILTLVTMVDSWQTSRDEYAAQTSWQMTLLEV